MTTRYSGFVVTLTDDIREDDAEAIVTALRMVKGVASVQPVDSDVLAEQVARDRANTELVTRLSGWIAEVRRDW